MNELKPIFYICPVMVFQTVKDESPSINSLREIQNREVSFFRWFKFTLKPPYTIMSGHLLSTIWDTSH